MHCNAERFPLPTTMARNMAGHCRLFPVLFPVLEQVRERQDLVYIYVRKLWRSYVYAHSRSHGSLYSSFWGGFVVLWHSPTLIQVSLMKTSCAPALSLVSHLPRTLLDSNLTWTLCPLQYHEPLFIHVSLCVDSHCTSVSMLWMQLILMHIVLHVCTFREAQDQKALGTTVLWLQPSYQFLQWLTNHRVFSVLEAEVWGKVMAAVETFWPFSLSKVHLLVL